MILIDLNVVLDVIQKRAPGFAASANLMERVIAGEESAALSAHAVTTIHYLVARYQDASTADQAVDWLLRYFDIVPVGRAELQRARVLGWRDFEDAVVAAAAESADCELIVTRNVKDFARATLSVLTPEECLQRLQ